MGGLISCQIIPITNGTFLSFIDLNLKMNEEKKSDLTCSVHVEELFKNANKIINKYDILCYFHTSVALLCV